MNQVARRKEKCKTTQTWGTMMSFFSFIRQRKSRQTETNLFFWMSWKQAEGKNKLAIEFGHGGKTRVKSFQTILTVQMKITPEWFYCKAKEAVDIGVPDGINVRRCETLSVVWWLCELEAFDLCPGGLCGCRCGEWLEKEAAVLDYKWLRCLHSSQPLTSASCLRLTCSRG